MPLHPILHRHIYSAATDSPNSLMETRSLINWISNAYPKFQPLCSVLVQVPSLRRGHQPGRTIGIKTSRNQYILSTHMVSKKLNCFNFCGGLDMVSLMSICYLNMTQKLGEREQLLMTVYRYFMGNGAGTILLN